MGLERIAAIKNAFYERMAWSLRALSDKTGISQVTCYRIVTQILEIRILSKNGFRELTPRQLESRVVYIARNLRTIN